MKKIFIILLMLISLVGYSQIQDEKNVSLMMDLQPILQLDMQTPDQIDFVFDDIYDYYGGITKYGATILKVSSTVNWDLYVVAISSDGINWDNQLNYGGGDGSTDKIPLSALEIYQYLPNSSTSGYSGAWADYSTNFKPSQDIVAGQNSVYYSTSPYTVPGTGEKYVQGHGSINAYQFGGSYLTQNTTASIYYTVMDFRILPSLPAIFPAAGRNDGFSDMIITPLYAQPGVYTMNLKYVLIENM